MFTRRIKPAYSTKQEKEKELKEKHLGKATEQQLIKTLRFYTLETVSKQTTAIMDTLQQRVHRQSVAHGCANRTRYDLASDRMGTKSGPF